MSLDDTGAGPELNTIDDAMAELDRRAEERKAAKAADKARAKGRSDDPEDDDPEDDKRRVRDDDPDDADDKPAKAKKAKASAEEDADGDEPAEDDDDEAAKRKGKKAKDEEDTDEAEDDEGGDSDDDDEESDGEGVDEPEEKTPKKIKLKVGGRDVEVATEEVGRYIDKAHEELGGMREHVQKVQQWADGHAKQLMEQGQFLAQVAHQLIGQPPDQSLIATAPQEYLQQREAHQQRVQLVQALQNMSQQHAQRLAASQEQALGQFRQRNVQALLGAMPDLADPAKLQAFHGRFNRVAQKYGFTPQEVASMVDHRLYLMVRDLGRLADMEAKREASRKDVREKLRAAKPLRAPESGASMQRPREQQAAGAKKAKSAFMRSGRTLRDAQLYFERAAR